MGQAENKQQQQKKISLEKHRITNRMRRTGVDLTNKSQTSVYHEAVLQVKDQPQKRKFKKIQQNKRKSDYPNALKRDSVLMETNNIDEADNQEEERELAKFEEMQERNLVNLMKTSQLQPEKKEVRQSVEEFEKSKSQMRLSLPVIPENSLISEEVPDQFDKCLRQNENLFSTIQEIEIFLEKTRQLLEIQGTKAQLQELVQQSKLKNEYLSKNFLPSVMKVYQALTQRIYSETVNEFQVVAEVLEREKGQQVSLDSALAKALKEQSLQIDALSLEVKRKEEKQKMAEAEIQDLTEKVQFMENAVKELKEQTLQIDALSLEVKQKEDECEMASLEIQKLMGKIRSLEEDLQLQEQICSEVMVKKCQYKNQAMEKEKQIRKLTGKSQLFDKIKNKIKDHSNSKLAESMKY